MAGLFMPEISVWEKVLRAGAVYLFILVAFRFSGKRQVGQLTPFDLVVLLIISNIVQNAMIGPDNSLLGAFIGVITVLVLNWLFVETSYRFKKARRMLEGEPVLLVHNGKVYRDRLERERLTMDELLAAIRENGLSDPLDVRVAMLEENGQISVIPREKEVRS
jgi:uncharacterized membrane protein YcaP (DUF421 family)